MSMTRERVAEWFETHMPTGRVNPVQKQAYLMDGKEDEHD